MSPLQKKTTTQLPRPGMRKVTNLKVKREIHAYKHSGFASRFKGVVVLQNNAIHSKNLKHESPKMTSQLTTQNYKYRPRSSVFSNRSGVSATSFASQIPAKYLKHNRIEVFGNSAHFRRSSDGLIYLKGRAKGNEAEDHMLAEQYSYERSHQYEPTPHLGRS